MSDLTPLRELTTGVLPPPLEDLDRVLARRQRRRAGALAACAAALVVAVTITGTTLFANDSSPDLIAPDPTSASPSPSETTGSVALTPEQIRDHPDATKQRVDASQLPAGVGARIWTVCLVAACDPAPVENRPGDLLRAVEVTGDRYNTSAVYAISSNGEPAYVIDDWFLVDRNHLVNGAGEDRILEMGEPAPAESISGPLVFDGSTGLDYIDLDTLTLHPLRTGNRGIWEYWGADDTWWWGNIWFSTHELAITRQGVVWRDGNGAFGVKFFDMTFNEHSTQMLRAGTPGTMAAVDQGPPRLLHVSTDFGATWETRLLPEDLRSGDGRLPEDWESLPDAP